MSSSPFAVLVFDVAANVWSKVQPPMRRFLRSPALVELGGGREGSGSARVGLVASVEKSRLSVPRSVRVWTLRGGGVGGHGSSGGAWSEVARMPQDVHEQFAAAEGGRGFECAAHGDFVVLAPRGGPAAVPVPVPVNMLIFNSRRNEWQWAPPCPYVGSPPSIPRRRDASPLFLATSWPPQWRGCCCNYRPGLAVASRTLVRW
jgi:hypothetical protein